jgi:hypothetical protein
MKEKPKEWAKVLDQLNQLKVSLPLESTGN